MLCFKKMETCTQTGCLYLGASFHQVNKQLLQKGYGQFFAAEMMAGSSCNELSNSRYDVNLYDEAFFPSSEPLRSLDPGDIVPCSNGNWEMDFLNDQLSDPVLQYINQMLFQENMDGEPGIFQDPLALQTTEKSLYDVLHKDSSPSPHKTVTCTHQNAEVPDSSSVSISADPPWIFDPDEPSVGRDNATRSSSHPPLQTFCPRQSNSFSSFHDTGTNAQMDYFAKSNMIPSIFSDSESILLFKRGMEEGSKFLPAVNQPIGDSAKYILPAKIDIVTSELVVNGEKDETAEFHGGSRGRKHHHPDDNELNYHRRSKQHATAVSMQEDELSEIFDCVLLNHVPPQDVTMNNVNRETVSACENRLLWGAKSHAKKTGIECDAPDLRALLVSCAQSIAANDRKTANEQLRLIKRYASPTGDPEQRLATFFTNALEARLAGTGREQYIALTSKRISAAEELKAYRVYHISPFKAIPVLFGNQMILERASKATTLHIIDFGILYGFQWPSLIQHLSHRPGGPPKLRITGIDIPQPGFRPVEGVEETGRRLARYCKRFDVPFEYHAIATRNWETIRVEDLKVTRGEVLIVNSQFRFKTLLDDTVEDESPREGVLNLIRNLNPDIFLSDHANGLHGAPLFLTRFREALFFFSALIDAIDTNLPRHDEQRLKFEQNFFGTQIMSLVACEGRDRVEMPETYKQWQTRYIRAGFKLLPLKRGLMKELRDRVKKNYHKDFVFDEDGYWMFLGWKGKIITASSCWIPA